MVKRLTRNASRVLYGLILLLASIGLSGCHSASQPTLYQQIGCQPGLERLVDLFINQIGRDKAILPYFAKANVSHFRQGFITHLCDTLDGPCDYQGDSMVQIHTGMQITEADFNRVVELLINAMTEAGIAYTTQNQILARLAPLRGEVIKI
ncbi:group 1 truncated hemoglobin [Pseudoalteromonas sp. DL2-H2.2]|uniref:group I truncated hemoglobin n=1 Tax=Pseudoalteromonas sp. DL2-H2.2 TaxID=2908889 RepID=UPI001F2E87CB|nr:group 1 truncated hemoglobin [Pseudoalteromonas sp. DL2-H2.2]MCF2907726.1 group 1 truncated hemoglobin [Pseudoalteromonas sp. DL2-H2.2]